MVLALVSHNGEALQYAADNLKGDPEVVLAAVKQTGDALRFAPDSLVKDNWFMYEAYRTNAKVIEYAGEVVQQGLQTCMLPGPENPNDWCNETDTEWHIGHDEETREKKALHRHGRVQKAWASRSTSIDTLSRSTSLLMQEENPVIVFWGTDNFEI